MFLKHFCVFQRPFDEIKHVPEEVVVSPLHGLNDGSRDMDRSKTEDQSGPNLGSRLDPCVRRVYFHHVALPVPHVRISRFQCRRSRSRWLVITSFGVKRNLTPTHGPLNSQLV